MDSSSCASSPTSTLNLHGHGIITHGPWFISGFAPAAVCSVGVDRWIRHVSTTVVSPRVVSPP